MIKLHLEVKVNISDMTGYYHMFDFKQQIPNILNHAVRGVHILCTIATLWEII